MLPTPSTSHVSFENVYEPAEDSFLLLDTLSSPSETAYLQARFAQKEGDRATGLPIVLEIGTGSGVILAFVTAHAERIFGRKDILTIGTDINVFASHGATETVYTAYREHTDTAATFSDVVNADLATTFPRGTVDVLIFNPPYVPTEAAPDMAKHAAYNERAASLETDLFNRDSHLLALSYAGGTDGMEVTNRLLDDLSRVLHPTRGAAYILLCAQNKPYEVIKRMAEVHGLIGEIVGSSGKLAGWEKLCIIRLARGA